MRLAILPALALLALAACGRSEDTAPVDEQADSSGDAEEIITGGSCSYEESIIEAEVVAAGDGLVELTGPDGESFYMQAQDFGRIPAPGQTYTIKAELITEGTCTPEIYTVMD